MSAPRGLFARVHALLAGAWLNATLVFLALNLVALAVLALRGTDAGPPVPPYVRAAMTRVFPELSADDVDQLLRESRQAYAYEPFTQFRERPASGRFVNVDPNGYRVSRDQGPWPPDRGHVNVFLFGGSTVFNYQVPDDRTIASYLQARLDRLLAGRGARVYNFGRGAYFSTQERVLFEQLLLAGHVPDLAVFVDGLNEFFVWDGRPVLTPSLDQAVDRLARRAPTTPGELLAAWPVVQLRPSLRWGDGIPGAAAAPAGEVPPRYDDPGVAERVIARWTANRRLVEATAAAFGVVPVFVWQPVPTYGYDLRYHVHQGDFGQHEYSRYGYPRMADRVRQEAPGPHFVWCADVQRDVNELLYVDRVHYAPRLSALLADCIADAVAARHLLPVGAAR